MTKAEIERQMKDQQLLNGAFSQEFAGLIQLYSAAAVRDNREEMNSIEGKLHDAISGNLDCLRSIALLTRRWMAAE